MPGEPPAWILFHSGREAPSPVQEARQDWQAGVLSETVLLLQPFRLPEGQEERHPDSAEQGRQRGPGAHQVRAWRAGVGAAVGRPGPRLPGCWQHRQQPAGSSWAASEMSGNWKVRPLNPKLKLTGRLAGSTLQMADDMVSECPSVWCPQNTSTPRPPVEITRACFADILAEESHSAIPASLRGAAWAQNTCGEVSPPVHHASAPNPSPPSPGLKNP